jgi:hypothetical protein
MRHFPILFLFAIGILGLGCGQGSRLHDPGEKAQKPEQAVKGVAGKADEKPADKATPRKIIYTGIVDLIVDDFDGSEDRLSQLVEEQEGYLAGSELQNQPGVPRSGTWTVRVPTRHFPAFMQAVVKLGEVRKRTVNSQDITDAYFDRAARLKADETEEKSLLGLLEKTQGRVEDILKVREQIRTVRGQIEENRSQLQRWDKDVDLATVTVKLLDRRDYTPPLLPDFSSTLGRTFQGSIDVMITVGKGIILVLVALAPWLAVLALLVAPAWILWRRRRRAAHPVVVAAESSGASSPQGG